MTSPTRKEIERLVSDLKNGDWRRFNAFVADVDNATTVIEDVKAERDAALARIKELEESTVTALSSLVGAISLLERGGKKAVASDRMFAQMLSDYKASVSFARAALTPKDA